MYIKKIKSNKRNVKTFKNSKNVTRENDGITLHITQKEQSTTPNFVDAFVNDFFLALDFARANECAYKAKEAEKKDIQIFNLTLKRNGKEGLIECEYCIGEERPFRASFIGDLFKGIPFYNKCLTMCYEERNLWPIIFADIVNNINLCDCSYSTLSDAIRDSGLFSSYSDIPNFKIVDAGATFDENYSYIVMIRGAEKINLTNGNIMILPNEKEQQAATFAMFKANGADFIGPFKYQS